MLSGCYKRICHYGGHAYFWHLFSDKIIDVSCEGFINLEADFSIGIANIAPISYAALEQKL